MTKTRKILSYVGPLWLLTVSHAVLAQTAPKTTAPAAGAAASASATAPASSPAAASDPVSASADVKTGAAFGTTPSHTADASATLPPPAPVAIPTPPPPLVEPAPAPPPPVVPEAPKSEFPKKISIGNSGFLQIGVLFQTWFLVEDGKALTKPRVDDSNASSTWDTTASFRFRRAQIKLSGDVVKDTVGYFVLFDLAKTMSFTEVKTNNVVTGYKNPGDTSALLDFMITYKTSIADISIGQWKVPISYEGTTSSSELLLPERSMVSRYFGDYYDQGIRAEKKFEYVKYSVQMLDGVTGTLNKGTSGAGTVVTGMSRTNQLDNNRQKDLALRLEFTPIKGVMIGGAAMTSVGQRTHQQSTHDIVEADFQFDYAGFLARGEFHWGWQGKTGGGFDRTKSRGMVGSLGYTIAKKVQPVARIGYLDVDATTVAGDAASQPLVTKFGSWYTTDEIRSYELGLNYLIDGKFAKIQAAYAYHDLDGMSKRQQFTLSGQVSF